MLFDKYRKHRGETTSALPTKDACREHLGLKSKTLAIDPHTRTAGHATENLQIKPRGDTVGPNHLKEK